MYIKKSFLCFTVYMCKIGYFVSSMVDHTRPTNSGRLYLISLDGMSVFIFYFFFYFISLLQIMSMFLDIEQRIFTQQKMLKRTESISQIIIHIVIRFIPSTINRKKLKWQFLLFFYDININKLYLVEKKLFCTLRIFVFLYYQWGFPRYI